MTKLSTRQLRTYVLAAQIAKEGHDLIAALMPFFEPAMKKLEGKIFDPEELLIELKKIGIRFNLTTDIVTGGLVPWFVYSGWIREDEKIGSAIKYRCSDQIGNKTTELELNADTTVRELGNCFKNFIEQLSPLIHHDKTQEELEELLLNWLVSVNGANKKEIARIADTLIQKNGYNEFFDDNNISTVKNDEAYLCARFVKELSETDDKLFSKLSDITSVALLTDVLLDFHYPKKPGNVDLKLVLDAPFLLDALGVSGKEKGSNAESVLDMAKKLNCKITTFSHCIQEASSNLKAVLDEQPLNRFGPTGDALRKGEVKEHYVQSVLNNLEAICKEKNISIITQKLDEYSTSRHKFFAEHHYENLLSKIWWHQNVAPRERDATSTTLIMRLRGNTRTKDLLQAKHVMLSNNPRFAATTQQYCREEGFLDTTQVPPVMHQRQIATILWICSGENEARDVSRKQLLSACETALKTNKEVFEKAREESNEFSDPKERKRLEPLLSTPRSTQILMDKTLGNPQIITIVL